MSKPGALGAGQRLAALLLPAPAGQGAELRGRPPSDRTAGMRGADAARIAFVCRRFLSREFQIPEVIPRQPPDNSQLELPEQFRRRARARAAAPPRGTGGGGRERQREGETQRGRVCRGRARAGGGELRRSPRPSPPPCVAGPWAAPGRAGVWPHTRRWAAARCARALRVRAGRGRERCRRGRPRRAPLPWPARRGRLLSRGRRGPGGGAGQHERGLRPRCARRRRPSATLMLSVPALQI